MIDWLDSETGVWGSNHAETLYPLDKAKAKYEVRELEPGWGWLVIKKHADPDNSWMYFAVLQFHHSDGDDTNVMCEPVFHGEGPGGKNDPLRECRHTWWGEDGKGYIFYPRGSLIAAAFQALSEFYDEMVAAAQSAQDKSDG